MTCDLKQKVAVPPLMQQLSRLRLLYRQAAENERTGGEPEILACLLPLQTNTRNRLDTTKPLL